jgi:predicted phosphohydrolase
MSIAFDLISDLHLETWPEEFDWVGQPTSPVCVVAGDISSDPRVVRNCLKHLSNCYAAVFYIDGNDEHKFKFHQLKESYQDLARSINRLNRVTYLQNNVVVIDGVAIIGTNGWWGYDLDEHIDRDECKQHMVDWYNKIIPDIEIDPEDISDMSRRDVAYLINSVQKLQTHNDVKKIVIVTHTVPGANLIKHDIDLAGTTQFNHMGNRLMHLVHTNDSERKIHTWCFGHYHGKVDQVINGIRYINNCRGRGDTLYRQDAYFPKRITIET